MEISLNKNKNNFYSYKWKDFIFSIIELENKNNFFKNQNIEFFFQGINSICFNKEIVDKILEIDVKIENLNPIIKLKPRYLYRCSKYLFFFN